MVAWDGHPKPTDLGRLRQIKKSGQYLLGFGSSRNGALKEHAKLCDAWMEADTPQEDNKPGKLNHVVNAVAGWVWMAECTAAFTRKGRMPPMWKSWAMEDGKAWSETYFRKTKYHKDVIQLQHHMYNLESLFMYQPRYLPLFRIFALLNCELSFIIKR